MTIHSTYIRLGNRYDLNDLFSAFPSILLLPRIAVYFFCLQVIVRFHTIRIVCYFNFKSKKQNFLTNKIFCFWGPLPWKQPRHRSLAPTRTQRSPWRWKGRSRRSKCMEFSFPFPEYSVIIVGTRRINLIYMLKKFSVPLTSESGQADGVFRQLFYSV